MPGVIVHMEQVEPSTGETSLMEEHTVPGSVPVDEAREPAPGVKPPPPDERHPRRATDAIPITVSGDEYIQEPPD